MIEFQTERPNALLNAFKAAIRDGKVRTWEEDKEGDFGHLAQQWKGRGWLHPEVTPKESLAFFYTAVEPEEDKREVYAYLHSKMIDTFISHFPHLFTFVTASPNPTDGDSDLD